MWRDLQQADPVVEQPYLPYPAGIFAGLGRISGLVFGAVEAGCGAVGAVAYP
jgi:hypothetical protein